jgi:FkbM family methyltransferase
MRKIFLDIGTHNGQTLVIAKNKYPDFDLFVGVEPVESLCQKAIGKVGELDGNFKIFNRALDYQSEPMREIIFYEEVNGNNKLGSSILKDKRMKKQKEIKVKCQDIRDFFEELNITNEDYIIMKIDVEGKEYDILHGMIKHELINMVDELYIEWHWHKVESITEERHLNIVRSLNELGFKVTGDSKKDEFYCGK